MSIGVRGLLRALVIVGLTVCGSPRNTDLTASCIRVGPALRETLGTKDAAATLRRIKDTRSGLGRDRGKVWFVSTPNGATWVTNIDPQGRRASGLILPLNPAARKTFDQGSFFVPGVPALRGLSDADPFARAAHACASYPVG